jgi:hypothetical protein
VFQTRKEALDRDADTGNGENIPRNAPHVFQRARILLPERFNAVSWDQWEEGKKLTFHHFRGSSKSGATGEMFPQYKSTSSFPSTAAVTFGKAGVAFRAMAIAKIVFCAVMVLDWNRHPRRHRWERYLDPLGHISSQCREAAGAREWRHWGPIADP